MWKGNTWATRSYSWTRRSEPEGTLDQDGAHSLTLGEKPDALPKPPSSSVGDAGLEPSPDCHPGSFHLPHDGLSTQVLPALDGRTGRTRGPPRATGRGRVGWSSQSWTGLGQRTWASLLWEQGGQWRSLFL